jgi:hypothetical protein
MVTGGIRCERKNARLSLRYFCKYGIITHKYGLGTELSATRSFPDLGVCIVRMVSDEHRIEARQTLAAGNPRRIHSQIMSHYFFLIATSVTECLHSDRTRYVSTTQRYIFQRPASSHIRICGSTTMCLKSHSSSLKLLPVIRIIAFPLTRSLSYKLTTNPIYEIAR